MEKSLILFFSMLILMACGNKKNVSTAKVQADSFYTCSMHPQIMELKPGKCPICQMELIAVKKNQQSQPGDLILTSQQILLGNVQVDTVRSGNIADEMILNATLSIDQNRIETVSARVTGRIDRLYFKNIGDYIPKGAKLYELYSEELNNAKQELIASLEKKELLDNSLIDFARIIQSARNKLKLWGMTESQINQLAKSRKSVPTTSFYSTAGGYITSLGITEGAYVAEGRSIVQVADLSILWAEAQLYSSQRAYISSNARAVVSFPDMPGKILQSRISFANPELSAGTRINIIRAVVANTDGQLKPGMPAYVAIQGQHKEESLSLPSDAVLQDSKGASVWIKTGKNTFRNKMVTLGAEDGQRIQIKSGLQNGDVVVTSGAYLINSEYIFKHGAEPMAGMKM